MSYLCEVRYGNFYVCLFCVFRMFFGCIKIFVWSFLIVLLFCLRFLYLDIGVFCLFGYLVFIFCNKCWLVLKKSLFRFDRNVLVFILDVKKVLKDCFLCYCCYLKMVMVIDDWLFVWEKMD